MKKGPEQPFLSWLEKNKIKGVLFDLDDTIIQTSEIFNSAVQQVVELYAKLLPQLSIAAVEEIFSRINMVAHSIYAVNPKRWHSVIPEFEREMGIQKSQAEEALAILANIYTQPPKFEQDAEAVIRLIKEWGLLVGLVTHANIEWTNFKLSSLGLGTFFDSVEVVSEDKLHKDSNDWVRGAEKIRLLPQELLAVGDNIRGDAIAAVEAGFKEVVWIDKKNGWKLYRQGELPSGIHTVTSISQLLALSRK